MSRGDFLSRARAFNMRRLEPPAVDPESEMRTLAAGVKLATRDQLRTLVTEVRLLHWCWKGRDSLAASHRELGCCTRVVRAFGVPVS